MRRGTLITLIVLFVVLAAAAISQIVIASGDREPLPGPQQPGDLPAATTTSPASSP
jgi:hypothetical protein